MAAQLRSKLIPLAIGALCVASGTAIFAASAHAQTFPSH